MGDADIVLAGELSASYLNEVFGNGGIFAKAFPGYESRPSQVLLATAIEDAITGRHHVLGEGPCGVGKSLAYLVPAIWHAHHQQRRVIVCTANIALQEQLVSKDLPMLARVLPWDFTYALLKGRNNYACPNKLLTARTHRDKLQAADAWQLDEILEWADETETGDQSELPFLPAPAVWNHVSVGSEDCLGSKCPQRFECFADRARKEAWAADIVVTNYHMLFAHMALRMAGTGGVLPEHHVIIMDEAHEAADIARDFLGFKLSEFAFVRLASACKDLDPDLCELIRDEASRVFAQLARYMSSPAYDGKRLRKSHYINADALRAHMKRLAGKLDSLRGDPYLSEEEQARAELQHRHATRAIERLDEGLSLADPGSVYWLERSQTGRCSIRSKPIHVAQTIREELFAITPSIALVSATMTTGGTFEYVRRELGVPDVGVAEVIAESPFDFQAQALLVIPPDMPEPNAPDFADATATALKRVISMCGGRTLALFTSYKNMNAVHAHVVTHCEQGEPIRVLKQGDAPRTDLTKTFKEDVGSVLLGTSSFWTGIDVQGEALTGLVIDRLPFPTPSDPLIDAIQQQDPRWFFTHAIPRAAIMLRQGVGRLIRSQKDVGVVVILDKRLLSKGYGATFLRSLPNMRRARDLNAIPLFLQARQ